MAWLARLFICAACVAVCGSAGAQLVPDVTLNKHEWITHLKTTMPLFLCRKTSELRACFAMSSEVCEEDTAAATRVCVAQVENELEGLVDASQGKVLGAEITACVTKALSALHANLKKHGAKCDEVSTSPVDPLASDQPAQLLSSGARRNSAEPAAQTAHVQEGDSPQLAVETKRAESAQMSPRRNDATLDGADALYTLVSPQDLGKYWKVKAASSAGPTYPMALKGSNTFCTAVGFGIDAAGNPNSVTPLHTTAMPSATERKLHIAVEKYINSTAFVPTTGGPLGVPVFTYVVLGRYGYRHGSTDDEKDRLGSRAASTCAHVAEHKFNELRARSP